MSSFIGVEFCVVGSVLVSRGFIVVVRDLARLYMCEGLVRFKFGGF